MIYCHDENAGIPPIPDDLWPILVAARRQGAEYILFDDDDLPREDLPVYFGNKPNGVAVRSLDEGDLFFCGTPSNPTMVCCVRRADADEARLTAFCYNLGWEIEVSRLSGEVLGYRTDAAAEFVTLPLPDLLGDTFGLNPVRVLLTGDPDFDFESAEQSDAALDWARRSLALTSHSDPESRVGHEHAQGGGISDLEF
jgi:hypothetical protein